MQSTKAITGWRGQLVASDIARREVLWVGCDTFWYQSDRGVPRVATSGTVPTLSEVGDSRKRSGSLTEVRACVGGGSPVPGI